MKKFIIPYLLILTVIISIIGLLIFYKKIDFNKPMLEIVVYCFLFGVLGGIVHCLRAYYLHTALFKNWDKDWDIWYYLRPIVSGIMGFISLIFIKAGLLLFSSGSKILISENNIIAYFAIAFMAGYNVQNFLAKLEDISKATLGIEKKSKANKKEK